MDHKIIVVDDDPDFIEVIRKTLQGFGFKNIQDEVDPLQAVSLLEKGILFDLALIDMTMPEMDGVEVCRLNDQADRADLMLPEIQALINRQSWRRDAITQVLRGRFLLLRGADARQVLEVFYKAQVAPHMYIQPNLQYIATPSGIHRDAIAVGVRFQVAL